LPSQPSFESIIECVDAQLLPPAPGAADANGHKLGLVSDRLSCIRKKSNTLRLCSSLALSSARSE